MGLKLYLCLVFKFSFYMLKSISNKIHFGKMLTNWTAFKLCCCALNIQRHPDAVYLYYIEICKIRYITHIHSLLKLSYFLLSSPRHFTFCWECCFSSIARFVSATQLLPCNTTIICSQFSCKNRIGAK